MTDFCYTECKNHDAVNSIFGTKLVEYPVEYYISFVSSGIIFRLKHVELFFLVI